MHRILRALWNALSATVRTNAYQTGPGNQFKEYLSFKIESQQLRELPLPKPLFEIFVFSPRMEGVHLRMGYVARGGIRWSDRREDFRTEVLGLMKAQQVKNTVIVPVGALLFRSEGLRLGLIRDGNRVELVPIILGKDFGTEVEVLSGIRTEDLIILNPADSLTSGAAVRPVAADAPRK